MGERLVRTHREDAAVVTIELSRPDRLNALTDEMLEQLNDALEAVKRDTGVAVVVVTGSGRGFCVGADRDEAAERGAMDVVVATQLAERRSSVVRHIRDLPMPVIAAVNGPCAGSGLALAAAADLRYAAASAVFKTAFVDVGLPGDGGGSWLLSRLMGPSNAVEAYLLSERIDAARAQELGLVSSVFPDDELSFEVGRIARRIADIPREVLLALKANHQDAQNFGFVQALRNETARHAAIVASGAASNP